MLARSSGDERARQTRAPFSESAYALRSPARHETSPPFKTSEVVERPLSQSFDDTRRLPAMKRAVHKVAAQDMQICVRLALDQRWNTLDMR